jgi:hypothetical protein
MYAHVQGAHGDVVAKALHFLQLATLKDPSLDSDIKRSAQCIPSKHGIPPIPERKHSMTNDYTITLQDNTGRVVTLFINGATIDEMVDTNTPEWLAIENVERNAFENAIAEGIISDDAWLIARDE